MEEKNDHNWNMVVTVTFDGTSAILNGFLHNLK